MSSKRPFWFQHIEAWQQSGLSQTEYTRRHELSVSTFGYYRQCYLKEHRSSQAKPATLLPVHLAHEDTPVGAEQNDTGITLTSPGGFRIELACGFDPNSLQAVLRVLEAT